VMQTMADVLGMSIKVARTEQSCAFGSAMFGAVVAGIYQKVEEAQDAMGQGFVTTYHPNSENHALYSEIYKKYQQLGRFTEEELNPS